MSRFVNLHNHTHYSELDGASKVEELVKRAKELNQHAIAVTDHGNMYHVFDLYKQCKKHDVQPIYGIEFYHRVEGVEKRLHLIAYAKSMVGLRNLYKLHELSYRNAEIGPFGKRYPIITYTDLFNHKQDIIITTSCLAGHIPHMILTKQVNDLYVTIEKLQYQFKDDFYIELQTNQLDEQALVNSELNGLAKLYNIKTIASNDTHYTYESDWSIHEMLLCIQSKQKMDNEKRFKFSTQDYWLKSKQEMLDSIQGINSADALQALHNTVEIAEKCKFDLVLPTQAETLPVFGDDEKRMLRDLCNNGWKVKKHNKSNIEKERARYELSVIEEKGYSGYFLIVADYINWAKQNNVIVGGGRGSSCGSFITYLCGITTINPIEHQLLYERFLNPERISLADVDSDFSDRTKVVNYLQERWKNVSAIIAFGKLTAKSVFRKILAIHGFNQKEIMDISKTFPKKLELTLKDCESSKLFAQLKKTHPKLIEAMYRLEGVIDHITTHAAGIVIAPVPISDLCPVIYDHKENMPVVGYDKYTLEELAFYKFDILALSTLTILNNCIKLLNKRGIQIDFDNVSRSDNNIYDALCNGNVHGVFQLSEQSEITKKTQPKTFSDVVALNAIVRPGTTDMNEFIARRNGKQFEYYNDIERPYMEQTNNMIIYQEQFMLRVNTLSTLTLGQGDSLRKNKHIETDIDLKNKYLEGCKTKGLVNDEQAEQSWNDIVESVSGGYSFCKSHACCYADIAYQTAWLKHYYPIEFMCALMTQERCDKEQLSQRVTQCKKLMDIPVLPPHINKSKEEFVIEHIAIRYSLNSLDGIGDEALRNILSIQPVQSFQDFLERADLRVCNKTVVLALIKSGCFDDFNLNRNDLIIEYARLRKDKKLLSIHESLVYNSNIQLSFEKEILTFYLTSSPYEKYGFKILEAFEEGSVCCVGGEITKLKQIVDKNKRPMAFLTITNQHESFEAIIFATEFKQYESLLVTENIIIITGKKQNGKVLVDKITNIME